MKFAAASLLAVATGASAALHGGNQNNGTDAWASTTSVPLATGTGSGSWPAKESKTTVTVESFVYLCSEATTITHNSKTYTATAGQEVTIEGPATVVYPVTTSSWVSCGNCGQTGWGNGSAPAATGASTLAPVYTPASPAKSTPSAVTTSSPEGGVATAAAGKLVAMSGAGLAGLLGLAVFIL